MITKDGTVHPVGHGRADHAGLGDGDVPRAVTAEKRLPPDDEAGTDGNAAFENLATAGIPERFGARLKWGGRRYGPRPPGRRPRQWAA